jgi:hypothetical protein
MRKSTQRAAVKSIIGMSLLRATRADQTVEANWIKLDQTGSSENGRSSEHPHRHFLYSEHSTFTMFLYIKLLHRS